MTNSPDSGEKLYRQSDIDEIFRAFHKLPYSAGMELRHYRGFLKGRTKTPEQIVAFLTSYAERVAEGIREHEGVKLSYDELVADQRAIRRFLGVEEVLQKLATSDE